jgi:hypothetical protein
MPSSYNSVKNGLNNRTRFNYGGADRIIFVAAADIYQTQVLSGDTVDKIVLYATKQFHLFESLENISLVETPSRGKNGTIYDVTLAFNSGVQTIEKHRLFDQLADTDLVAIVQDKMRRWWALGLDQPLKMTTTDQKIDDDNNNYAIKFTTRQRERSKIMSNHWIDGINSLPFSQMVDSNAGVTIPVNILVQSPTAGSNAPTAYNFLNEVTMPPSGYVIKSTDGIIMAVPGRTVKLPQNAVNGNYHVIKDAVGTASDTTPIMVDANGSTIDGSPLGLIETTYGSLTISYSQGKWFTRATVN